MSVSPNHKENVPEADRRAEGSQPLSKLATDESLSNQHPPVEDHHKRNRLLWWFTVLLLIVGVSFFCLWYFYLRYYQSTDDAYANGNMININSAISGSVVAFYTDDTDLVVEGQLLVLLDNTEYQVEYEKALASLASTVLQVRQLYDSVEVNRAEVESISTQLKKTRYDFENRSNLVDSLAVSNEEYVHSKDDLQVAEHNYTQAQSRLRVSLDAIGNTTLEKHPNIDQQKAVVRQAYYNLQHCAIYAPATGYVAQRSVDVGQWVAPSAALLAIIPTDYVWVDANFKETQLAGMRVGQPAIVTFDLYGSDVKYRGKVLGIASGSGSVFSLIPPQNATGNWIKIVQRLPVRISLDPKTVKDFPVRLGISAEVSVDITNQNLPRLVPSPLNKSVGTTTVFDIHLEKVDKIIDDVINQNLKKE